MHRIAWAAALAVMTSLCAQAQIVTFQTTDFANDLEPLLDPKYALTRIKWHSQGNWDLMIDDADQSGGVFVDKKNFLGSASTVETRIPFILSYDGNLLSFTASRGSTSATVTYDIPGNPTDINGLSLGLGIKGTSKIGASAYLKLEDLELVANGDTYGSAEGLVNFSSLPKPASGYVEQFLVILGTETWSTFSISGDLLYYNTTGLNSDEDLKFEMKVFATEPPVVIIPESSALAGVALAALLGLAVVRRRRA